MNKNIILLLLLFVFALGFLIGKITNSTGRYTFEHKNNQVAVFDSQTGKIYVQDNQDSNTKYFTIDVINANVENYKSKNTKKGE